MTSKPSQTHETMDNITLTISQEDAQPLLDLLEDIDNYGEEVTEGERMATVSVSYLQTSVILALEAQLMKVWKIPTGYGNN